ncbi:MAG: LacI family transcriptional regulator [Bacillus sp. (in: Bacteria)]|nr:LacI family transcriptional regulator [Bacillus sp. (in: firmicutes)]MCM1425707.1 LacI family transcriptional regulator [Eubacterium sp.]
MTEDKNLTIGDIAEELGVSKTTVSRVISGKGRIGNETRERVLAYIEAHHYTPNAVARGLAQSRTYNIGLTIPGDYNIVELPFFQSCMLGISHAASLMGYDILISIVTAKDISGLERIVINHKVDGVILTRTLTKDAPAAYLKEAGIPFVTIGSLPDKSIIQIDNDHRSACKDMTKRLLMQGMENIALIGGSQDYVVTGNRLQGFLDAYQERGENPDKEHIYLDVGDAKEAEAIVDRLLREETACIITMDDYLCSCVLRSLQRRKTEAARRIKVASFYDGAYLEKGIPAIHFDIEELGETTCKTLIQAIEGEEVEQRTLLGYQIVM